MMTEEAESNPGYLRDWSSHEAIRSLTAQVSYWRILAALASTVVALGIAGVALWSNLCRVC